MSEPALVLDDVTPMDLRKLADRLLEATRVEYVDDGVLLIMNPPASEHRAIVRLIARAIDRAYVAVTLLRSGRSTRRTSSGTCRISPGGSTFRTSP